MSGEEIASMSYGAHARILIQYEGELSALANKLSDALNLREMFIKTIYEPPYVDVALGEAMGWESWLSECEEHGVYNYQLTMRTEDSFEELLGDRMHDLSPWLARIVSILGHVKTKPWEYK